jgi:adenylate kinase
LPEPMEEARDPIAQKVQALSDIELAVLLCLVVDQHCIIETDATFVNGLEQELRIVSLLNLIEMP